MRLRRKKAELVGRQIRSSGRVGKYGFEELTVNEMLLMFSSSSSYFTLHHFEPQGWTGDTQLHQDDQGSVSQSRKRIILTIKIFCAQKRRLNIRLMSLKTGYLYTLLMSSNFHAFSNPYLSAP